MFGYAFVSLTPEQVEARRRLLDQAGLRGYFLPIALLAAVYVLRLLSRLISNPKKTSVTKASGIALWINRLKWQLSNTYNTEYGPLHVLMLGLAYASTLVYLIVKDTGDDYMHVTKACGHVAVSQFPIHYLLSIKHPQSPVTLATGLTHERLNAYHRLLGRVIYLLLVAHATLYLNFFVAINVLGKRVKDWDVIYGLTAFSTLNVLASLAFPLVRKKAYHRLFYRSHVVLSALLAVVVWLHVPYTRNYVGQAAFFWITNGILRSGKMAEKAQVQCQKVSGQLVRLTASLSNGSTWESWVPGMHGYLNQGGLGPRTPFTVVDVFEKSGQAQVTFIVRDLGGPMTAWLGKAAAQEKTLTLEVEGPYGEAKQYISDVLERTGEPALIVAGGVGATYAIPIYLALAEKRKSTSDLSLVWIVGSLDDARWGFDMLRGKAGRSVRIFVTRGEKSEKPVRALAVPGVEITMSGSRPNLTAVAEAFLGRLEAGSKSVSVFVCGPNGLSSDLRKGMAKYAWDGRKIKWYEEQFGMGGS